MDKIRLFWWNERVFHNKAKENYGDLLGKYLVEKISGKKVLFTKPNKFSLLDFISPIYVTIGSILGQVNHKCIVWGSGIITKDQYVKQPKKIVAVRGPQTRKRLMELGYVVPEVYGDPALLLPDYYFPTIQKKYKIGIVPHYVDYSMVKELFKDKPEIKVIDLMTNSIESTTDEFLQCEKIISSSLHGIILAHAYRIPAVWQKFSENVFGDDVKYQDYFESVNIPMYKPNVIQIDNLAEVFEKVTTLPNQNLVENIKLNLIKNCPFKN